MKDSTATSNDDDAYEIARVEELRQKLTGFLAGEFAREEDRRCVAVELFYACVGYRDERVCAWEEADDSALFKVALSDAEGFARTILKAARDEADEKAVGKHRFVVRVCQYLGTRPTMSFSMMNAGENYEEDQMAKSKDKNEATSAAPLDPRKKLLARMSAQLAASVLVDPSEHAASPEAIAEISVTLAEAILQKIGL